MRARDIHIVEAFEDLRYILNVEGVKGACRRP